MDHLSVGRIVHFVTENGEHRPAIVVQVWNKESGCCNMQVFLDGTNDAKENFSREQLDRGLAWVTSVMYSEEPKPRTWHWPKI
jgi:hypothetical protein